MALTADVIYDEKGPFVRGSFEVQNAEVLYANAFAAIGGTNNATAANIGRAFAWADDTANLIPGGFVQRQKTGDTGAADNRCEINLAGGLKNVPVTGLAGSIADHMRVVYGVDDGAFTLTRPTTIGWPIGIVYRFISSTRAWVYFLSFGEQVAMSLFGGGRRTELLGIVAGGATTGNVATGIKMNRPGKIVAVYGIVIEGIVDADADLDINLEIDATNVTGGVIEWLTADAIGAKKAGTAITAENVFHEGSLIDIEVVANTASTAADVGRMAIYADIEAFLGT